MNLQEKVGHKVLVRGDVVKSPSGSNDWVVIDNSPGGKLVLACISKYMTKDTDDISEWHKVR
jgi:hypothetical protein